MPFRLQVSLAMQQAGLAGREENSRCPGTRVSPHVPIPPSAAAFCPELRVSHNWSPLLRSLTRASPDAPQLCQFYAEQDFDCKGTSLAGRGSGLSLLLRGAQVSCWPRNKRLYPGASYFPILLCVFAFEASINTKFHFFTFETSFYSCLSFWRGWGKIRDCPQEKVMLCSFVIYTSEDRMEPARLLLLTKTLKIRTLQAFLFCFLNGAHIQLNLFKSECFRTIYI